MGGGGTSNQLPVDRGWSWVICFASFVAIFLLSLAGQGLAVLFLELVKEFESSVTTTSLTVMFLILSISISSVFATSVLVPNFGERRVIVVAGLVFSACSVGYSLAPNIGVFIAFCAIQGTALGSIYVPAMGLLSHYFLKRRSIATAISNSGACVAFIVSPLLVRLIMSHYGLRGTFLILAGIKLHMVVIGMLMRPVSVYRTKPKKSTQALEGEKTETSLANGSSHQISTQLTNTANSGDNDFEAQQKLLPENNQSDITNNPAPTVDAINHCQLPFKQNGSALAENGNVLPESGSFYDRMDSQDKESLVDHVHNSELYQKMEPPHGKPRSNSHVSRQRSHNSQCGSTWSIEHDISKVPGHYGSVISVASGVEAAAVGVGTHKPDDEDHKESTDSNWKSCCFIVVIKQIFDPSLLNQWAFRVFLMACIPSATNQFLMQYLPTIAVVQGVSADQGALLMTITGLVDLVSRIILGFLADTHILKSTSIVGIAQCCLGILCQFNPLFRDFPSMLVFAIIMGLFIGTRQSMMPLMLIQIVGMERMSRCLSLTAMIATISAASHSPMLSAIMEATGSYSVVLHYVGMALFTGGAAIALIPLIARLDTKLEEKKKDKNSTLP